MQGKKPKMRKNLTKRNADKIKSLLMNKASTLKSVAKAVKISRSTLIRRIDDDP